MNRNDVYNQRKTTNEEVLNDLDFFSNRVEQPYPVVYQSSSQPTYRKYHVSSSRSSDNEGIRLNRNYLISIWSLIRILLIIFLFAAFICTLCVSKNIQKEYHDLSKYFATRSALLFFSLFGWVFSLVFFIFGITNAIHTSFFQRLPWILIVLIVDLIFLIPIFILSVISGVRETEHKSDEMAKESINIGAFAAAAFFGFLCSMLYIINMIFSIFQIVRRGLLANYP